MDQCTDLNSLGPLSDHILVQWVVVLWLEYAGSSQREEATDHIDWPLHLHCQVALQNELSYPNLVRDTPDTTHHLVWSSLLLLPGIDVFKLAANFP